MGSKIENPSAVTKDPKVIGDGKTSDKEALKVSVETDLKSKEKAELNKTEQVVKETPKEEVKVEEKKEEVVETDTERQERINRRIKVLQSKPKVTPTTKPPVKEVDDSEIQKLIKDGKTEEAIKLAEERAVSRATRTATDSIKEELSTEKQVEEYVNSRNESNKKVWQKHPEVLEIDELFQTNPEEAKKKVSSSELYKTMQKIWESRPKVNMNGQMVPDLALAADGPEIVLELAERRLGLVESGKKAVEEGRKKEAERHETVTAASAISAPSGSRSVKVESKTETNLSPDEKLVARRLGLTEEEYASNKEKNQVVGESYYSKNRTVKRKQ